MRTRVTLGILALAALAVGLVASIRAEGSHAAPRNDRAAVLEMVSRAGPGGSAFQDAILADGAVSAAELQSAYDATFACMTDAGVDVIRPGDPRMAEGARLGFAVGAGQDRAAVESTVRSCQERYLDRVQLAAALLAGK
ncbi:MAG: hypothetical protein IT304_04770 [Dehalococcoidia bacterium]|nr:hypothetical protein [Dehalococcoidia bacterium]